MEVHDYLMQFYETFEQQRHFNTVGEQPLTLRNPLNQVCQSDTLCKCINVLLAKWHALYLSAWMDHTFDK